MDKSRRLFPATNATATNMFQNALTHVLPNAHRAAVEQPRADKMTMITNAQSDEIFDYQATAELFPEKNARARPRVVKYMRFDHAAGAIRFAVEQLPAELLSGAYLERSRYIPDLLRKIGWRKRSPREILQFRAPT
jgi:hypothetical protein